MSQVIVFAAPAPKLCPQERFWAAIAPSCRSMRPFSQPSQVLVDSGGNARGAEFPHHIANTGGAAGHCRAEPRRTAILLGCGLGFPENWSTVGAALPMSGGKAATGFSDVRRPACRLLRARSLPGAPSQTDHSPAGLDERWCRSFRFDFQ